MPDPRASSCRRNPGSLNRLRRALCLATFLLWARSVQAETVAILQPASPSPDMTQALTLVRGELLSVGFDVTLLDRMSAHDMGRADSLAWLEPFAERGVSAVVEAIGEGALEAVDVWVASAKPQRYEVTRVAVDPAVPTPPEMLALRAIEALRAGLLQTDWAARKRRNERVPPTATLSASALQAPPDVSERLGVEVGASGVMSLDRLGPAVLPTVQVGWSARPWLALQALAAGFGTRSTVTGTAGKALVEQRYALLGTRYRARATHRLWPFARLAAGVLHTSVEGQAGWGTGGHKTNRWSVLVDASLGAGLRLYGHAYLTLAAHVQIAAPYVAIYLADIEGATSGRPNILLTLTVGAWL